MVLWATSAAVVAALGVYKRACGSKPRLARLLFVLQHLCLLYHLLGGPYLGAGDP